MPSPNHWLTKPFKVTINEGNKIVSITSATGDVVTEISPSQIRRKISHIPTLEEKIQIAEFIAESLNHATDPS